MRRTAGAHAALVTQCDSISRRGRGIIGGMKMRITLLAALLAGACGGSGGGGDNGNSSTPPPPVTSDYTDSVAYSSAATASLAGAQEVTAVTRQQLGLGGTTLNYTATVGHLTALQLGTNAPEASFFYVAYTLDGADPAHRPVTFFYNGGPGSASVWLHLGSFGPRRLVTHAPSTTLPTPLAFADSAESLLDVSDLVFVDAVGTGFSEAIAPNVNRTFWSVDADAAVFRDFVMRYVAVNARAASPKFLFGESYGTPRSAVLANLLEGAGTHLAGVVLQSSVLNYNSNCGIFTRVTISCYGYLPSYGAVGAWLGLTQPPQPVSQLPAFMAQMRTVASTQYDPAVRAWASFSLPPAPPADLVAQLTAETGMAASSWATHFNMDPTYFHDNLVPGSVIGLYDGRMVAARGTPLAADEDPSSTYYDSSFSSTIISYLSDLHYTNPSTYVMLGNQINVWNFSHAGMSFPDTIPDLAAAFAQNPSLKVFSANGYHDIVTPFYQTENDLARLAGTAGIAIHFYQGGHMTYLDDTARVAEKADLAAFYHASATTEKAAGVPAVAAQPAAETPAHAGPMPAAVFETRRRGPAIPESLQGVTPVPPSQGAELRAQVAARLRAPFDAAPAAQPGRLTREEARAAGLGFIAAHFDAIDAARRGWVTFDDVQDYLRSHGATTLPE
jgi:carboxypeptidase C (cathepsin A)